MQRRNAARQQAERDLDAAAKKEAAGADQMNAQTKLAEELQIQSKKEEERTAAARAEEERREIAALEEKRRLEAH